MKRPQVTRSALDSLLLVHLLADPLFGSLSLSLFAILFQCAKGDVGCERESTREAEVVSACFSLSLSLSLSHSLSLFVLLFLPSHPTPFSCTLIVLYSLSLWTSGRKDECTPDPFNELTQGNMRPAACKAYSFLGLNNWDLREWCKRTTNAFIITSIRIICIIKCSFLSFLRLPWIVLPCSWPFLCVCPAHFWQFFYSIASIEC